VIGTAGICRPRINSLNLSSTCLGVCGGKWVSEDAEVGFCPHEEPG
jgi:hypothetical protein